MGVFIPARRKRADLGAEPRGPAEREVQVVPVHRHPRRPVLLAEEPDLVGDALEVGDRQEDVEGVGQVAPLGRGRPVLAAEDRGGDLVEGGGVQQRADVAVGVGVEVGRGEEARDVDAPHPAPEELVIRRARRSRVGGGRVGLAELGRGDGHRHAPGRARPP